MFPCRISDLAQLKTSPTAFKSGLRVITKDNHKDFILFCLPEFSFRAISNHLPQTRPTNLDIPKSPGSLSKPVVITVLRDISKSFMNGPGAASDCFLSPTHRFLQILFMGFNFNCIYRAATGIVLFKLPDSLPQYRSGSSGRDGIIRGRRRGNRM